MAIEGFNYKEFASNLSMQAKAVLPPDLSPEDKNYVVNIVNNFCFLAGEALFKDANLKFDVDQASIITQFIGEWAFHKSVDLIHGKIPMQFRDPILQKVAFTVFEVAKQAMLKDVPQPQMINLVEHHVKKVYEEALVELHKQGALDDVQLKNAASKSNIDEMAQADNDALSEVSDTKILKLAAFAMLLRKLPDERVSAFLNKFEPNDAKILIQYIQMDDLESKIDSNIVMKCLEEIKMSLPLSNKVNLNKTLGNFSKIISKSNQKVLGEILQDERQIVKDFISDSDFDQSSLSPWVIQVICNHVEEKLNDNQKKIKQ